MSMKASSAPVSCVAASDGCVAHTSSYQTSRPGRIATSTVPSRRTTRMCSSLVAASAAASAVGFIVTAAPRRRKPSATQSILASQSASRLLIAPAP